jgi:hypothetical protein
MLGKQLDLLSAPDECKPLSPVRRRLLDAAGDIMASEPEELAFQHSLLCQTYLPTAKPKPDVLVWKRRQGRATLLVEAGKVISPQTNDFVQLGLPYGPKARLLLMHLNSEAVRSGSPILTVEASMTAFFRRLMGSDQNGREVRTLKAQLSSLAAATFRMGIVDGDKSLQMNSTVVSAFELWSLTGEGQRVLWPATLRLSLDYFDSLSRYAVPLDERAIASLAHSAMALDIYVWLSQRLHRIPAGKGQLVPWTAIMEQFGQGYSAIRFFRRDFLALLAQVRVAYPEAALETDLRGVTLWQSPPPVRKRLVTVALP